MGDVNLAMEELRRQLEETEAARREEARLRAEAETALRDANAERAQIPQNAHQYMHPTLRVPEPAIVLPEIGARNFEIKTSFITLIKTLCYEGKPTEDPIRHVKIFLDLCETIAAEHVPPDYIRLKAFKWTLGGKALAWLESLPSRSITTWQQLYDLFMNKFFPPAKTTELRGLITSYRQWPGESFVETWERFKDLIAKCPTHGQARYVLQHIFFTGLDAPTRSRINLHTACGFLEKDPTEAWELLDKLANYDAMYETPLNAPMSSRGSHDAEVEAQAQALIDEANRMRRKVSPYNACQLCHSPSHTASTCPNLKQVMAAESHQVEEANYFANSYRSAYNPYQQRAPPPTPYYQEPARPQGPPRDDLASTMLDMFHRIDQKLDVNRKAQDEELQGIRAQLKGVNAHLGDIDSWKKGVDNQLGQLASHIPRPQGQLPGRPDENPRGQIAAINLRSGKELPGRRIEEETTRQQILGEIIEPLSARYVVDKSKQNLDEEIIEPTAPLSSRYVVDTEQQKPAVEIIEPEPQLSTRYLPDNSQQKQPCVPKSVQAVPKVIPIPVMSSKLPFPKKKKDNTDAKYEKFIEVLKGLNITIPFTDALSEMPAYAKFLKEILAKKRLVPESILECNSLSLSTICSAMHKKNLPEKLCDPGRFAITIGLGNYNYKALVDLGASASLMPLSIWTKINMGDLRPVNMKLFMADGSCVHPTGVIDDVPVKVGKYFVPNDFVVMDIEEDQQVPIILGRPFLATAGACIDVREGLLTFDICGDRVTFDFSSPETQGEEVQGEVKTVESNDPIELDDDERQCVVPKVKDDLLTGTIANLQLEENFVWKHGVLESWHLVGKKVASIDDAKGVDASSSSGKKVGEVASFSSSGEKGASKPPDLRQVRRGRTQFDWDAFYLEMEERARPDDDPT